MRIQRSEIVAVARTWIGTPYHHQASVKGAGTDCLGLVRGVWREIYGKDAETPPPYTRDLAETTRIETMLTAARRHLTEIERNQAGAGDVIVFRLRAGAVAKHSAILTGPDTMIHAFETGPVAEVHLGQWWRRRIAAGFSFPGVTD